MGVAFGGVTLAVTLAGCESGRQAEQAPPPSDGFFADGTDFAD